MPRSPKSPVMYNEILKLEEKYTRFATPEVVAKYRAERLKCSTIVEIGSGIGGQTFAFSKTCKKVIAIEINKEFSKILKDNLEKLNIKNVQVLQADALSKETIQQIKKEKPDVIFCDTEREEFGERTLDSIKPNLKEIIKSFSPVTKKIAIEIPPFTKTEELENFKKSEDFEREFLSLNGKLNRLTLYFNELKTSEVSVVSLPSKERISSNEKIINNTPPKASKVDVNSYQYLYLIDPSIILANLVNALSSKLKSEILLLQDKPYLLSNEKLSSPFLESYKILSVCENKFDVILKQLKELHAGKVIIRYKIPPESYWNERNKYENKLQGNTEIHIFADKTVFLCEKI